MKSHIIQIAVIAQFIEHQYPTLKVKGSSLAGDRIIFLIIKKFSICNSANTIRKLNFNYY